VEVIVPSVALTAQSPRAVTAEFRRLLDGGARIICAGTARRSPRRLLALGYVPRYKTQLFGVTFYFSEIRKNEDIRFTVAYLAMQGDPRRVYARLFYKDGSLLWRSASHFARSRHENWIGKGDLKLICEHGEWFHYSDENTTDLPLELQAAVESLTQRTKGARTDHRATGLVLRRSSDTRLMAYNDFIAPRRRAAADPRNLVNGGRAIAQFTRENDPSSLEFVRGYEPDFSRHGIVDECASRSTLYGGRVRRFRILSKNRHVQYLFMATRRLAWIGHPQALTTELSSYGVRTIDVHVPDELVVPGMEYHYMETEDPPVWVSQIPPGFAGPVSPVDAWRADASRWLDALPVIREFRRRVL